MGRDDSLVLQLLRVDDGCTIRHVFRLFNAASGSMAFIDDVEGIAEPSASAIPSGTGKGTSSASIGGRAFGFRFFFEASSRAFSAAIRSSSTLAGSSDASCATSRPRTASCRMVWRSGATSAGVGEQLVHLLVIRVHAVSTDAASSASARAARIRVASTHGCRPLAAGLQTVQQPHQRVHLRHDAVLFGEGEWEGSTPKYRYMTLSGPSSPSRRRSSLPKCHINRFRYCAPPNHRTSPTPRPIQASNAAIFVGPS